MSAPAGRIEWHDIQGGILHGYGYGFGHGAHVLVHAESTESARGLLAALWGRVTSAAPWPPGWRPTQTLNLAVTHAGLQRLGLPGHLLERFPEPFRQTMQQRAEHLGDVGRSAPTAWDPGLGTGVAHVLLSLHAQEAAELERAREGLHEELHRLGGLIVVHDQPVKGLPQSREHFGYADGFAQPDVEGVPRRTGSAGAVTRGGGVAVADNAWRPLKLGEFVLGYTDEDRHVVREPDAALVANGSYLVYRKLYQDVAGFREALARLADESGQPLELLAAKIVGRFRDGTALPAAPDHDVTRDLTLVAAEHPSNDFRYLPDDAQGFVCPAGAHIRRTNPRDALGFTQGRLTARHRMIRRGMPYGEPLPPGAPDDGVDRGLVFLCYNADLERQFETVQALWCNDGDAFGLGDDRDFLLGGAPGSGKMTIPVRGGAPLLIPTQPQLVQARGGEYLFTPGLTALHGLAVGAWS